MPFAQAPQAVAVLQADGGSDGYVDVGDSTPFWPGARVWLRSNDVAGKEYVITEVDGAYVGLRLIPTTANGGQSYGRTPVNEYTVAQSATLFQESQVVPAEFALEKKIKA